MAIETQTLKEHNAKVIVHKFINALNEEDFDRAKALLADDVHFKGVMGERKGADIYMADMQKMKFKYSIKKTFVDKNDVCLWYDIGISGRTIFSCGWYKIEDEKIKSFQVIFDPRPIL